MESSRNLWHFWWRNIYLEFDYSSVSLQLFFWQLKFNITLFKILFISWVHFFYQFIYLPYTCKYVQRNIENHVCPELVMVASSWWVIFEMVFYFILYIFQCCLNFKMNMNYLHIIIPHCFSLLFFSVYHIHRYGFFTHSFNKEFTDYLNVLGCVLAICNSVLSKTD